MQFLTGEWLAALQQAAEGDRRVQGSLAALGHEAPVLTLRQTVTGCPPDGHSVGYLIELSRHGVTFRPDDPGHRADVSFRLPHDAAWAAFTGAANAQTLLIDGRLRIDGDLGMLGRHTATFVALSEATGSVRAHTEP